MFTGIVETVGKLVKSKQRGTSQEFFFESSISHELKIDQSLNHNGICLTITSLEVGGHWVTAVKETLSRTNLGSLKIGDKVNLERCMSANGRFDGHIVQGHVDTVARVVSVLDENGSWLFRFQLQDDQRLTVEKGSITVNGVSLTCFDIADNQFSVAIIPYTFEHTNFHSLKPADHVNIEFDIVGKYLQRMVNG